MNVIGYKKTPEFRQVLWNDLLESKRAINTWRNSNDEQLRNIAQIDLEFFGRTLNRYVS